MAIPLYLNRRERFEGCKPYLSYDKNPSNLDNIKKKMGLDLSNRINLIRKDGCYESHLIDGCINALIPSADFRRAQVGHWEKEKTLYQSVVVFSFIGAVGCGAGAFVKKNEPIAVALTVLAVAAAIFTLGAYRLEADASKQVENWKKDPAERVAHNRTAAYKNGLSSVMQAFPQMDEGPSTLLLFPIELQDLYNTHWDKFNSDLYNTHPLTELFRKQWLDDFTTYNPVSKAVLTYVFKENIPEKFVQVSTHYEDLRTKLNEIRTYFKEVRQERRRETKLVIDGINTKRKIALTPAALALEYATRQAKQQLDRDLAGVRDPRTRAQLKEAYNASVRSYQAIYNTAAFGINLYFDAEIQKAEDRLKQILGEVDTNEASAHAPYYDYARSMLEYAYSSHTQALPSAPSQEAVYHAQQFQAEEFFHFAPVEASAPPLDEPDFVKNARAQLANERDPNLREALSKVVHLWDEQNK